MSRVLRICFWLTLWAFCLGTTVDMNRAWAEQTESETREVTRAREYFRAGAQAYSVGAYAAAVQAFEQAYELAPRPAVLFSIAQAEKRLYSLSRHRSHLEKALRLYRAYLTEDPEGARRSDASHAISELEPLLAMPDGAPPQEASTSERPPSSPTRLMIASPVEGARISLDGASPEPSPLIREVPPGEHRASITAPGYLSDERRIVAIEGSLVTFDVSLTEEPSRLWVEAPAGAELSIDGRLQGTFPFPRPLELAAGKHLIVITKRGHEPWSEERELERGKTTNVVVQLPRTLQRTTALILFGASASALTVGGIFGYFALAQQSSARSFLAQRGQAQLFPDDLAEYDSIRKDRDNLRLAAAAAVGSSLILAATGGVLFSYDAKLPPTASKSTARLWQQPVVLPVVAPRFIGLSLEQRF